MTQKKYILTLLFIVLFSTLYAQTDSSQSTTVIFLGKERNKEIKTYSGTALKLGVLDFISGLYGLHVEHEFGSIISMQAGGGLTGKNYSQGWISELSENMYKTNNNPAGGSDIDDQYFDYETREPKGGYFFMLMPKFYYEEDGFDGRYIGFCLSYRRYNYDAKNIDLTSSGITYIDNNPIHEFENQRILGVTFGIQNLGKRTVVEWSSTVGIRHINGERRDLWYIQDAAGDQHPEVLINKIDHSQFYFDMSFKIGFYWTKKK